MYNISSTVIFVILCTLCNAINDSISYTTDKKEVITSKDINTNQTRSNTEDSESHTTVKQNKTVPWDTYLNHLITVTMEELDKIRSNVIDNYNLDELQIESVQNLFNNTEEYKLIIYSKLKKLKLTHKFNSTVEFMLGFSNISNRVVENVIQYNLNKVSSAFLSPTLWYKQTLKTKIQRQETKVATNRIDSYICRKLSICKVKAKYTEYLKEWLRHLLSVPDALGDVFATVPTLLEKHKDFIKSNVKSRQVIKYIRNSDAVVQKDTLDFVDEVLTNRNNVLHLVPVALRNSTRLLLDLFKLVNDNYNITDNGKLDDITNMVYDWAEGGYINIENFLDEIVVNMKLNLIFWPLDVQSKVKHVWLDIIAL